MTPTSGTRVLAVLAIATLAMTLTASFASPPSYRGIDRGHHIGRGVESFALSAAIGQACADVFPQLAAEGGCEVSDVSRETIVRQIVHYSFKVRVGSGPYDVIGFHRVVKERWPLRPMQARDSILLLHGDGFGFNSAFLTTLDCPEIRGDHALPVYLAQRGIDVWGTDRGWISVPEEQVDPAWAEGWGIDRELDHLEISIGIVRAFRGMTGNGSEPIALLGWSSGVLVGLTYLNREAEVPPSERSVDGLVYGDVFSKFTDPEPRQEACDWHDEYMAMIAAGEYASSAGLLKMLGRLAIDDPEGDSPIFEGFSNQTAAMLFAAPPRGFVRAPNYHFCAGVFDAENVPIGLQYTDLEMMNHWMAGAASYQPVQISADFNAMGCERDDVPWDDHWSEITVPILYVEATGGAGGDHGRETLLRLPNADITELIVQLHPEEERGLDFGHFDLWAAENAPSLVWKPILDWIRHH